MIINILQMEKLRIRDVKPMCSRTHDKDLNHACALNDVIQIWRWCQDSYVTHS